MTSFLILAAHSFASLDAPVNVIFELSAQDVGSFLTGDEHGNRFVTVGESRHRATVLVFANHQLKQVGFIEARVVELADSEHLVFVHEDSMV